MTNPPAPLLNKELLISYTAAIKCGDQEISYSQLHNSVDACTSQLSSIGIKPGDRVALVSPNSTEHIIALLSLWSLKSIACPLNTKLPHEIINDQLQHINAKYLLTSETSVINSDIIATKISVMSWSLGPDNNPDIRT